MTLPALTACEYGPIAFGASSVWMKSITFPFAECGRPRPHRSGVLARSTAAERDARRMRTRTPALRAASIIARLMSTYLGNASLSSAVKERVLSTFQQAVVLFKQGRTDEVLQGCGLILRMDPMFDPAKKLLEKARNPSAPIDVDALLPPSADDSRLGEARTAMAGRDFQRVLDLTTELLTEDLTNDDARVLNEQAREKTEAAPFVEQFIRKSESLAGQGNNAAARQELEKARALDSDHPAIRRVEQSMSASPVAAASSSSFIVDAPAGAPPGRGTAQAADFGFTFEEDKQQQGSALDFV